jgi:hypothetical protein
MSDDNFDWGELGADWWRKTAAEIGTTERHAKFACAKRRGTSNVQAARESGFGSTAASLRAEGWRVSKSQRVSQLLALASAESGGGYDGSLTQAEAKQILTNLARGSDPNVRIKSIESLAKIDATERERRLSNEEEGDPHTARVPHLYCEFVLCMHRWMSPWIKEFAPYLATHCKEQWAGASTTYLLGEFGQMRDNIEKLEQGELYPSMNS